MKAASTHHEHDDQTYYRANPGSPGKASEQTEEEHNDNIRGQDSISDRPPTDELGESHRKQHGKEDA